MLDDFVEAKRGGICAIMGDRLVNSRESNRSMLYRDAENLYGYAMLQKLPDNDEGTCFADYNKSLYNIKNTPDDSDYGYYIVCGVDSNDICKNRTEQLALTPNKKKYKRYRIML